MNRTGAWLIVYALEQIGIRFTFGIPGVHNTEIYDELNKSETITPMLTTHEAGAAFMADAVSRTSGDIGALVIVPAAGLTHALSGIGEAYLDGIPMLIIAGGIRRDTGRHYQLHQLDQLRLLDGIIKKATLIERHAEIVPAIFDSFLTATSGEPGPVFVEIPVNIQLFRGPTADLPEFQDYRKERTRTAKSPDPESIARAVELLGEAQSPGLFLGWGTRHCTDLSIRLAELLQAPVATTLQGLQVFPANHPLHAGMGFGPHAVPSAERAFADCDCLLALGVRFAEIPTGSFGMPVPENLIHGDINPDVFHKNYPARVTLECDARLIMESLLAALESGRAPKRHRESLPHCIRKAKEDYREEWLEADHAGRVNPARFFSTLRDELPDDAILVVDDGNHTYLTAELFEVGPGGSFLSPTDFNCMGYATPAAIGAKLVNPGRRVVGIIGDGAFLMTGLEMITATTNNLGIVYFLFHDGELSQISQGQEIPYNRKVCTVLGELQPRGVALATGAAYLELNGNDEIESVIRQSFAEADRGRPVVVDVRIDYSKRTRFTRGVVKTNLGRFPPGEKFRFIGRALLRRITG